MSTAVMTPPSAPVRIKPLLWTCEQFHLMGDHKLFQNRKLILVEGEILEMPPPNPRHNTSLGLVDEWLRIAFGPQFWVRTQMALEFGINTDPVPDVAVVVGRPRDYQGQATTAELLVEVSDSSLAYDTGDKASLYAAAGTRDYWVVDVENRRVIVFRNPQPDAAQKYGHGYSSEASYTSTVSFSPLAAPSASVTADELLP